MMLWTCFLIGVGLFLNVAIINILEIYLQRFVDKNDLKICAFCSKEKV
jgi:hypothetical protein